MKKAAQYAEVTSRLNNDNTLLGISYPLLLSLLFIMLQQREHKQREHNQEQLIHSNRQCCHPFDRAVDNQRTALLTIKGQRC
jgi:hypothetical protein